LAAKGKLHKQPTQSCKKKKEARAHTVKFYLQGTILLLFSLAFGSPLPAPLCSWRTGPLAKSRKPRSSRAIKISLQEGEWRHPKMVVARRFDNGKPSPTTFSGIITSNV
jgi:hypothetical protein